MTQVTHEKLNEIKKDLGLFPLYRSGLYRGIDLRPNLTQLTSGESLESPTAPHVAGNFYRRGTRCDYRSANTEGGH